MSIRLGVVMDPIDKIHYQKDSTLAMLWEAQARGWDIDYFEQKDLWSTNGVPYGNARKLTVARHPSEWFSLQTPREISLADLDIILMRKDPPFNEEYIYTTYLLEQAEALNVLVVNNPQSLRDCNEKFFATNFPQCTPPTLIAQSADKLHAFLKQYKDIVCKPLNVMGGTSVFRLQENDVNANVIFETLTQQQSFYIMAQQFIPAIVQGDKRILLLNGEPVSHALARIPQGNDWRGNLAVGAKGKVVSLTERDLFICAQIGPELKKRGLYFVGIDVIGDYLTEINITSPTCIREIDAGANLNISAKLFDVLESLR